MSVCVSWSVGDGCRTTTSAAKGANDSMKERERERTKCEGGRERKGKRLLMRDREKDPRNRNNNNERREESVGVISGVAARETKRGGEQTLHLDFLVVLVVVQAMGSLCKAACAS